MSRTRMRQHQCTCDVNHYNPPLTSETHLDLPHTGHKSRRGYVKLLGSQNEHPPPPAPPPPTPIHWTEAGLKVSGDQCHAPDCTLKRAQRQTGPAQWRQKDLCAPGPLWHERPGLGWEQMACERECSATQAARSEPEHLSFSLWRHRIRGPTRIWCGETERL